MFTGLVQDLGEIVSVRERVEGKQFEIKTNLINEIKKDDSVAVNGCCLTATDVSFNSFLVDAVTVTLTKTNIKNLNVGSPVNLELALRFSDRLGGHLVSGHVNAVSSLIKKETNGQNYNLWFKVDKRDLKYIVKEGSVAIDGVSLTIANVIDDIFMVTIIPHTLLNTTLGQRNVGDSVNIEFDMMAKYVENILRYKTEGQNE